MTPSDAGAPKKFPDYIPPTKIHYEGHRPSTVHLRKCKLITQVGGRAREHVFEGSSISIGAMEDNDLVVSDDTVSRYHCKIVQEETGYLLVDLGSTNGTFINRVRIKEGYLKPGCTIGLGNTEIKFHAADEKVEIVPSKKEQLGDMVGKHVKMRELYAVIEKIAPTSTTVVIEGETGTGKEVVAQTIHKLSQRAAGPMMVFDCGAVPDNLIESELFGHEKGSFTGAIMTRQGLFEMAHGGTLFLDELGELPLDLQPKLLRALEQREIRRVGSNKPIKVDVRIVAATNRNLEEEVKAGRFRQDLFYRLSVVRLFLPPLRERVEDIALLVKSFLAQASYNRRPDGTPRVTGISRAAMDLLSAYRWPGNVRELVNTIERAVSFAESELIEPRDLPETVRGESMAPQRASASAPMSLMPGAQPSALMPDSDSTFKDAKERWVSSFERDYILTLLKKNKGNISHAAREADIDRKYFRKLMRKYGIEGGADDDDTDAVG
jgi:transcriptional regulator with GAF, ATPase, and Fis domain